MPARSEPAVVYSEACIHNGVDIVINRGLGDLIRLVLEFIEPESLERLAAIATEAAAEFRERIAADNGEIA